MDVKRRIREIFSQQGIDRIICGGLGLRLDYWYLLLLLSCSLPGFGLCC